MRLSPGYLSTSQTKQLGHLFGQFRVYFVGGCVRNVILGRPVTDLDLCTDALPDQMMDLDLPEGVKRVPTGIDHGTVTFVIDGVPFEVTTFREDVETDGRHATVRFSNDVAVDAARRDFTMNAIYLSLDGDVIDPVLGVPDAQAGHVRFIGDAGARITEDYLRILRFFRFTAVYGDPELGIDATGLASCAQHGDGISRLAPERVTAELLKLLSANDPAPAVAAMRQSGILARVLPGSDDRALGPLVHLEQNAKPDPIRRLVALGGETQTLRLSRADRRQLELLRVELSSTNPAHSLAYRYGRGTAWSIAVLRAAVFEHALPDRFVDDLRLGAEAAFPVSSADLGSKFEGKALGDALRAAEARWIESRFRLTRDDLLKDILE